MAKRSTKSGSSKSTPRPVTPRRQTAIDAYTKKHGRAPPRSMSIKKMGSEVSRINYVDNVRGPQRRAQIPEVFSAVSRARAANAHYSSSHMGADAGNDGYQVGAGKRGFGNPNNQAAAQKAKGNKYEGPAG